MIHTIQISTELTRAQFDQFRQHKNTFYSTFTGSFTNNAFNDKSLFLQAGIINQTYLHQYKATAIINLSRLIHPEPQQKWNVFNISESALLISTFDALMEEIGLSMPPFSEWTADRVDYSINIQTKHAEEYIRLLSKQLIPSHFSMGSSGNGSLYLMDKSRYNINFYHKYTQLKDRYELTEQDIQATQDILRLEIQCKKPYLRDLARKYQLPDLTITHFLSPNISFDTIEKNLLLITGTSDYYRRAEALKKIESIKKLHQNTKQLMKLYIKESSKQGGNVNKTREKLLKELHYSLEQVERTEKLLKKHQINPITISDNKKLANKKQKDGLNSLYELFIDTFQSLS